MSKKPTIKTIAELAGVSHVTVSRALRGCSDISKVMTLKIEQIAKETGYTPNAFARNLSSKHSTTIGMIVPAIGNDTAYSDVFNAISVSAAAKGLTVLLGSCGRDIELEKACCRNMCENRVGALIISSISSDVSHIRDICKDTVPVIFLGGKTGFEEKYCITMDYKYSATLAIDHLYELGHRDIALFLYHPENRTIKQKQDGYLEAMKRHGLTSAIYWEGDSSDTFHAGHRLTERLIEAKALPSAIWCASDLMAAGVLNALKKHHFDVPNDVSLIGHDNLFFSEFDFISLTTFSLPKKEIGIKTIDLAISIMDYNEEEQAPLPEGHQIFRPELVKRMSTGIFHHNPISH